MRFISTVGIFILLSNLLVGCSPPNIQAIKQPTHEEASTIIVFRPDAFANKLNEMIVTVDDVDVVTLHNLEYTTVRVEPGNHKVAVRASAGSDSSESVSLKPTEVAYFEAAGSANNSFNFIPGTYLMKSNFYIERAETFNSKGYTEKNVEYK